MIYLTGHVCTEAVANPSLGLMLTPEMGNAPDLSRAIWAADNGCFTHPERFDGDTFLRWLAERGPYAERCLFAVAPDVPGNAEETLTRSLPFLHDIRRLGYRAALAAQDGLVKEMVPWVELDCLFIGGTTEWKLSELAYDLATEADARGKWVHMGRVNSWRRLKAAAVSGYDSADGTFLAFGPDKNKPRLFAWLATLARQETLAVSA